MSWKRLKDIVASTAINSNKMLAITAADVVTTVVGEDVVQEAISNSNTVKNAFNTQVSTAITNDATVQNSFNTQVSNAITNDAGVQTSLTTSINNVNNQAGTTVTYVNPPTVNGQPLLALPTSRNDGEHIMYDGLGTTDVSAKKILIKASAAERTQLVNFGQASSLQRTAASFQEILDNFYRFSHNGGNDHAGTAVNVSDRIAHNNIGGATLFLTNHGLLTGQTVTFSGSDIPAPLLTGQSFTVTRIDGDRFSVNGIVAYNLTPGDSFFMARTRNLEQAWVIDNNNNLTQPINWTGALGFASQILYDTYEGSILLRSSDPDNDLLGFVLCLCQTDENGNAIGDETISVIRTNEIGNHTIGAQAPSVQKFSIVYNLQQNDQVILAWDSTGTYPNGTGWSTLNPNGDAIKFKRSRDLIEVWLIQNVAQPPPLDDPSWDAGNYISVDLTVANNGVSAATLAKFREPARWGLVASSQGDCSWANLLFNGVNEGGLSLNPKPDPTINNMVFDVESGTTWVWNNGAWTPDPQGRTIHDYVDSGQMLLDTASGSLYVKDNGELQLLQSTRMQGVELTADSGITVNDIGKLIIAGPGCSTLTFDGNYGIGWHCTVLNKSGGTITLDTSGVTRFGDLLGPGRTEINLGNSREAKCYGNGHNGGANIHVTTSQGDYGT